MKVILVPCVASEWREAGRLMGRVQLPAASAAENGCGQWAAVLRQYSVTQIIHGPDELCSRTAKLLAKQIGASHRKLAALDEIDMGLWAGMTVDQLEARFATAHDELRNAPLNVAPPEGEPFSDALARIRKALTAKLNKNGQPAIGVVLRPFSLALAKFALSPNASENDIWFDATETAAPIVIDPQATSVAIPS